MAKKLGSKSGRTGPCWSREEVESMVSAIQYHEGLAQECTSTLVESREVLSAIEDKLRREKLHLSDRQLMLDEVLLRLSQISVDELPLLRDVESRTHLLAEVELNGDLASQAETDELRRDIATLSTKRDALVFKRSSDEITVRRCREAIVECTCQITDLQHALKTSLESNTETESRVSSLESVLLSMREHLSRMHVGDGAALYPRPLDSSPLLPAVKDHTLNACPVCTLWFDCFNYLSLACGHTYHPYCLHQLAQKSSQCLIPSCQEPFASRTIVALGIRPVARADLGTKVMLPAAKEVAGKSSHGTISGATAGDTSPTSFWEKESLEKRTPLSQSSQTDVTSKQCVPVSLQEISTTAMFELCGKKEVSVYLKGCGHAVFCFACIQGLVSCPLCAGAITEWGRINIQKKSSPSLNLASIDAHERLGEPGITNALVAGEDTERLVPEDALKPVCDDKCNDSSDNDNGLVEWCDSDEFSNGGARSRQDLDRAEVAMPKESDLPTRSAVAGTRHAKRFATVAVLLETEETGSEKLVSSPVGRKRGPSKRPTAGHVQKFKKIVEMAAEEILEPLLATSGEDEPMPLPRKKAFGRPPTVSKTSHSQKAEKHAQASRLGVAEAASVQTSQVQQRLPLCQSSSHGLCLDVGKSTILCP